MLIEILLAIIFISSASTFWYLLSLKLPEIIAIPDQVIIERLHEESAKFHLFLLHFKSFFHEKRYRTFFFGIVGNLLHRLHIFVMRFDNGIMGLLRQVRTHVQSRSKENQEKKKNYVFSQESMPAVAPVSFQSMIAEKRSVALKIKQQENLQYIPISHISNVQPKISSIASQATTASLEEIPMPQKGRRKSKVVSVAEL